MDEESKGFEHIREIQNIVKKSIPISSVNKILTSELSLAEAQKVLLQCIQEIVELKESFIELEKKIDAINKSNA